MDSIEAEKILLGNKKLRRLMEEKKLVDNTADLVLRARIRKKMTQSQLAKKIGTKQPSIARIENGDILPSLFVLEKISKALGTELIVNFEFLVEEEKVEVKPSVDVVALTVFETKSMSSWADCPLNIRLKDNSPVDSFPEIGLLKYLGGVYA